MYMWEIILIRIINLIVFILRIKEYESNIYDVIYDIY